MDVSLKARLIVDIRVMASFIMGNIIQYSSRTLHTPCSSVRPLSQILLENRAPPSSSTSSSPPPFSSPGACDCYTFSVTIRLLPLQTSSKPEPGSARERRWDEALHSRRYATCMSELVSCVSAKRPQQHVLLYEEVLFTSAALGDTLRRGNRHQLVAVWTVASG
ncbi:hypothetical protein MHYP_G00303960 [Metynnis hypsauchen]